MNLFRKRYRGALLALRRTLGFAPPRDDFADADERHAVRRVLSALGHVRNLREELSDDQLDGGSLRNLETRARSLLQNGALASFEYFLPTEETVRAWSWSAFLAPAVDSPTTSGTRTGCGGGVGGIGSVGVVTVGRVGVDAPSSPSPGSKPAGRRSG